MAEREMECAGYKIHDNKIAGSGMAISSTKYTSADAFENGTHHHGPKLKRRRHPPRPRHKGKVRGGRVDNSDDDRSYPTNIPPLHNVFSDEILRTYHRPPTRARGGSVLAVNTRFDHGDRHLDTLDPGNNGDQAHRRQKLRSKSEDLSGDCGFAIEILRLWDEARASRMIKEYSTHSSLDLTLGDNTTYGERLGAECNVVIDKTTSSRGSLLKPPTKEQSTESEEVEVVDQTCGSERLSKSQRHKRNGLDKLYERIEGRLQATKESQRAETKIQNAPLDDVTGRTAVVARQGTPVAARRLDDLVKRRGRKGGRNAAENKEDCCEKC